MLRKIFFWGFFSLFLVVPWLKLGINIFNHLSSHPAFNFLNSYVSLFMLWNAVFVHFVCIADLGKKITPNFAETNFLIHKFTVVFIYHFNMPSSPFPSWHFFLMLFIWKKNGHTFHQLVGFIKIILTYTSITFYRFSLCAFILIFRYIMETTFLVQFIKKKFFKMQI